MAVIEVLVGNVEQRAFTGFKARFDGEEVARYQVEERLVFTLYKCGWGEYEGYRVHKSDETDPFDPKYDLTPVDVVDPSAPNPEYHSLYEPAEIVSYFPMFAEEIFAEEMEVLEVRDRDTPLRR